MIQRLESHNEALVELFPVTGWVSFRLYLWELPMGVLGRTLAAVKGQVWHSLHEGWRPY
jgi:hypothetical protein